MSDHFYCGWFTNREDDSSITAWSSLSSLVLFQAVQWLHCCGALPPRSTRPLDIGWKKDWGCQHLPACWQHVEPSGFSSCSSEVTPDSQIRNLKLYEINWNHKRKNFIYEILRFFPVLLYLSRKIWHESGMEIRDGCCWIWWLMMEEWWLEVYGWWLFIADWWFMIAGGNLMVDVWGLGLVAVENI